MKPKKTVLDAELSFLAREAQVRERFAAAPLVALGEGHTGKPVSAPTEATVHLKLLVSPGKEQAATDFVANHGGKVISSGRRVLAASLPAGALAALDQQTEIRRAEAPRQLQGYLEEARGPATGLDQALAVHGALDGTGVVIGVIDSGVDWSHLDFRDTGGLRATRMEFFAHALRPLGSQESQFHAFDAAQIDGALRGAAIVPQGDPEGHGTHCASIAAGNGQASAGRFRGVAPRATLMAVRSEPLLDTHIIFGIREIFRRAGQRPCVINLSLGGHHGPHDGTTALENVIADESGPGRIVVVAAGNDGDKNIHWCGMLEAGRALDIWVRISDPQRQFVDVWIPRGDEVDILIGTPDGTLTPPTGQMVDTISGSFIAEFREDLLNGDQNLTLMIGPAWPETIWLIRLIARSVTQGTVHAWGGTGNPQTPRNLFPGFMLPSCSIGIPGTEERAITVASFVSRNSFPSVIGDQSFPLVVGQISPFSSPGPSRYGALKPDIAAPGQFVTAALAANGMMATTFMDRLSTTRGYITIQGTSMAAPFVAGVVALMLQREPTLHPEEIQQRLRVTARRDATTGPVWNPWMGFGKLDVEALLNFQ